MRVFLLVVPIALLTTSIAVADDELDEPRASRRSNCSVD